MIQWLRNLFKNHNKSTINDNKIDETIVDSVDDEASKITGINPLYQNTSGHQNVAIGYKALYNYSTVEVTSDKLFTMEELLKWNDEEYCFKMIQENEGNFEYCKVQSDRICNYILKNYPQIPQKIRLFNNITLEQCITAIQNNKASIRYINLEKFPEAYNYYKLLYS